MQFALVLLVLAAVVLFVAAPLRRAALGAAPRLSKADAELAELEAAREAKYREILDAELDHETGKLSDEDYAVVDQSLRAEAVEILHSLDTMERE